MNRQVIAALVLATASTVAFAGSKGMDRIADKLGLDTSQAVEVERILDESREARQAIRAEARTKIEAIQVSQKEQLATVLNPEQLASYEALVEARKDRMQKLKKDK